MDIYKFFEAYSIILARRGIYIRFHIRRKSDEEGGEVLVTAPSLFGDTIESTSLTGHNTEVGNG